MSGSQEPKRESEGQEERYVAFSIPDYTASLFEQNYPTETTSESAAISSDDFSSPFEEFERKSPGLRIVTTHTAGSGDIDRGPRSALDTSRAGGEAFERAMLKNLDSLDPEEDDRELYEILNGGEGAQGNPYDQDEQELELDFDPNAPEIEQVIVTKSNPQSSGRPIVLPTAPSTEKSSGTSDRAPTQPTTRSDDLLFSSSVAQQSQSETSTAESSSQYRRLIPRSHPSGSTVTSRMMAVGQEYPARTSAGNPTQVRASSYDGQSVSNIRSTAMGSSLSRPMLFRRQLGPQASQPYWQSQQRPVSAEPSTFQQQQRRHDQRRVSQQSIEEKSFAEGHRQGHYHGQVSVPGFDQGQQYTHGASIAEYQGPGFSLNDDDFAPLHGNQSNSYDPSMWQHTPHAHEETMVLPHRGLINDEDDDTIFQSIHDAKSWKHKHLVPNNRIDNTIPQTPEDQKRVVKRLFNAINDTQRAMPSTYVKYFEEHKYTAQFIESVCWTVLENCILRHTHGPLQAEEERAPFKARVAEFENCGDRIDHLVEALYTQKAICKKLMEPWHVHQVVDDPVGRIKVFRHHAARTENNKALNDRKAKQIAAGKAVSHDDTGRRNKKGKQQLKARQVLGGSDEEQEESSVGSSPKTQGLHAAFSSRGTATSRIQSSEPASSRKRKADFESSNIDSSLQFSSSGPVAKKAKLTTDSRVIAPKTERHNVQSNYQQNQLATAASGTQSWQPFPTPDNRFSRHPRASAYGQPSTGEFQGAPYFTQPGNIYGLSRGSYPEIQGYHTPLPGYDPESMFEEGNALGHHAGQPQQQAPPLRRRRAVTDLAAFASSHPTDHGMHNPGRISHTSNQEQGKDNAHPQDDSDSSEFTLAKPKRATRKN